ncbi:hypothetical protein [Flavobacterium sp. DG2-3]|mgnify:CR=1 FL=1|uniref:hypothetical protein n=1 Tax=Flavobacterium sp. DG2-3 TaxID=3068317 RepID=UPI00273E5764|nr:hypothetical protein [Flavobacterium sp. DG2-3]MDP5199661.1 hypothetical protein [Flavobacterium sp. DG2-3]
MQFYFKEENISEGKVIDLKCHKCSLTTSSFNIAGNSWAMNFLGIIGVYNPLENELFVTSLTKHEFQNYAVIARNEVSDRLKLLVNRDNLVFLKNEKDSNNKLVKNCPHCNEKLEEMKERSLEEFVLEGGKVYTIASY